MSVLIVGTTALDSIKTPKAENPRLLGGSASHAAVAASFFAPVKLVGGVGEDFPKKYIELYRKHKIDLEGLQMLPGKTFHWSGEYELNMNHRRTLATELGVIETFSPTPPTSFTGEKKLAATAAWLAEPPSRRGFSALGVLMESRAVVPTMRTLIFI